MKKLSILLLALESRNGDDNIDGLGKLEHKENSST